MFFPDKNEPFIEDRISTERTPQVPCPICLTGRLVVKRSHYAVEAPFNQTAQFDGIYDGCRCLSCGKRVLIERAT